VQRRRSAPPIPPQIFLDRAAVTPQCGRFM